MHLPVVVHLKTDLRSKEAASDMATLTLLSAMMCNSSTKTKVVLSMLREALGKAASVIVKEGDKEKSAGVKRKKERDYSTPLSLYRRPPPPS